MELVLILCVISIAFSCFTLVDSHLLRKTVRQDAYDFKMMVVEDFTKQINNLKVMIEENIHAELEEKMELDEAMLALQIRQTAIKTECSEELRKVQEAVAWTQAAQSSFVTEMKNNKSAKFKNKSLTNILK